ncbi:MAG TPA: MerR family transcriptional regulator [Actinomycetales bacterium]|nr:MerR family transcriptional regulator [Actinomycetales bacterium]
MRRDYTLAELAAAVGMTERNIRAYRSRGLIPPPRLRGRVGYYGFDHLAQLRLVQALTGRGLSLSVVAQLLERGLAQHELARLIRQELPGGPPVPLATAVVEELSVGDPDLLNTLVEHGVARRTERGVEADPALLALANQLVAHGVPVMEVSRLCLAGAQAASAALVRLRRMLQAPRRPSVPRDAGPRDAGPRETGSRETASQETAQTGGTDSDAGAAARTATDAGDLEEADPGQQPDAATTAVALELTTTAFRLALESQLSRREP